MKQNTWTSVGRPAMACFLALLVGSLFTLIVQAEVAAPTNIPRTPRIPRPPRIPPMPPMPKGLKTPEAVKAAILSGQIEITQLIVPIPHNLKVTTNIEYGRVGDDSLQLDLYQPRYATDARPGLLVIHGGGWKSGNRRTMQSYCVKIAKRGYVVATISYRFADEHPYPAAVHDAKAAVRWMRANAEAYHINPNQIGVMGGSAGAHLAMMVGYSSDVPELEGDGGNPGVSSRVQAVINFYGPTDLTSKADRDNSLVIKFMGGKRYEEAEALYIQASPVTHLTPDDPPTLTLHGTIDSTVPLYQAEILDRKLKQLNIPHRYVPFEGWPHAMDLAKVVNDRSLWEIEQFLAKYLPVSK